MLFILGIIGTTPFVAVIVWHMFVNLDGSLTGIVEAFKQKGLRLIPEIWPWTSKRAWQLLGSYAAFEAFLQMYLPGKEFRATTTSNGNVPVYKANGVQSLVVTVVAFFLCWRFDLTSPKEVYDLFGELLAGMAIFSIFFCVFLQIKGHVSPTDEDSGSCGNHVYDFWWGMELYPKLFGLNIKQFTNCRFGMMAWAVLPVIFACYQYERDGFLADSVAVTTLLMSVYNFKFFLWETGYFNSMDIQHDRAGYYICWGCLVWVPAVYASPALYVASVAPAVTLGRDVSALIAVLGLLSIWINYDSDVQRQEFRASGGKKTCVGQTTADRHRGVQGYETRKVGNEKVTAVGVRVVGFGEALPLPARNRGVVFLDRPRVVRKAAPVPVRNLLNVTTNRPLHQGRQEVLREVRQALGEVLRTGAVQDRSRDLLRLGKSPSAYNNGSREGNCCLNYTLMRMLWVTWEHYTESNTTITHYTESNTSNTHYSESNPRIVRIYTEITHYPREITHEYDPRTKKVFQ